MPLPTGGAWPPEPLHHVYDRLRTWSAWYGGDLDELASVYGGQSGMGDQTRTGFFASQQGGFRAGVRNMLQRWFHGAPTPPTEQRTKLHVPIAGDIASQSADLLFSEPPTFSVEDTATQDRLNELVDDGIHAALLEGAEVGAALGGVYLRVCWDEAISDRPWLAPVHADAAVPEFTYGKMTAVTFWRILSDDGKTVVRHLERHEPKAILHGVYVGDRDELGRRVALTDMPETAGLAEAITSEGDRIDTGIDQLTAVYIPNMRPNRLWRTTPAAAYLGRSDYSGAEPFMDALDEVYSSLMRDIRLAKARLIVPEIYLESQGRGKSSMFESEREIFSPVNTMGDPARLEITPAQFAIRVDEHLKTAQDLSTKIVQAAGYAAQSFGIGDSMGTARPVTATEIAARERRSYITRDRKIVYWRPALMEILEVLLAIDASVFKSGVVPERPDLEFGDGVSEDPTTMAQTLQLLTAAEAASTETKVRMMHPDWDDDQIAEEVGKIRSDQQSAMSVPGLDAGMGQSGPGAPPDQQPNGNPAAPAA